MKINIQENGFAKQATLLKKTLESKIPVDYIKDGMNIVFSVDKSLGKEESYRITKKEEEWNITGSDEIGLYYGIGKFLHSAYWNEEGFVPNPPSGIISPACSFRATYFSVHFYNWYHMAPTEELVDYLESMLLWGYNTIICILPIVNFNNFEDPVYFDLREKTRSIYKIAKSLGMKVGTMINPNQGLKTTTAELAADPSCYEHRTGGGGKNVCIHKTGAEEYLSTLWNKVFEQYADIGLDYVFTWPYDEGGCGCEECSPWGAKGFLDISHKTFMDAKRFFPNVKCILSTWYFDEYYDGPHDQGEYEGLYQRLKDDMNYVDYILVDSINEYPRYPLEHDVVKPILNFPEISMWGLYAWGGRGANPLPKRFQRLWDNSRHIFSGGMPYSEGLFEDIMKVQWIGYYWEPDKQYHDILKEYITYEYSGDVVEDVIKIMELIEINHVLVAEEKEPDVEVAACAEELAEVINTRLNNKAKHEWRWRILYIRTKLDRIIYNVYYEKYQGQEMAMTDLRKTREYYYWDSEEAQILLQELCKIYHTVDRDPLKNKWTFPPVKDGKVLI